MTDAPKSQRWAFTAYEGQWNLFLNVPMPEVVAEWGWQKEIGKEGREHLQGYMRLKRQVRLSQMIKLFPGVHVEISRNWNALVSYCKKVETSVEGTQHHAVGTKYISMSDALIRVAASRPECDYSRCEAPEDYKRLYIYEYDTAVAELLRGDPNLIGLYSQPQYERAYVKWRNVWVEHSEKTDRQTDTDGGLKGDDKGWLGEDEVSGIES